MTSFKVRCFYCGNINDDRASNIYRDELSYSSPAYPINYSYYFDKIYCYNCNKSFVSGHSKACRSISLGREIVSQLGDTLILHVASKFNSLTFPYNAQHLGTLKYQHPISGKNLLLVPKIISANKNGNNIIVKDDRRGLYNFELIYQEMEFLGRIFKDVKVKCIYAKIYWTPKLHSEFDPSTKDTIKTLMLLSQIHDSLKLPLEIWFEIFSYL